MGDDGGRPRRKVAPVRYNFEPSLEVKREHEWPVRPLRDQLGDARAHAPPLALCSCACLRAAAIFAPEASVIRVSRAPRDGN